MTDTPNWVAERAKCEISALLSESMQLVRAAAEQASECTPYTHIYKGGESSCRISCIRGSQAVRTCMFEYDSGKDQIAVTIEQQTAQKPGAFERKFTITTRWDAEKAKCRVVVCSLVCAAGESDQPQEFSHKHLWKAIQYILEPFFFPSQEGEG